MHCIISIYLRNQRMSRRTKFDVRVEHLFTHTSKAIWQGNRRNPSTCKHAINLIRCQVWNRRKKNTSRCHHILLIVLSFVSNRKDSILYLVISDFHPSTHKWDQPLTIIINTNSHTDACFTHQVYFIHTPTLNELYPCTNQETPRRLCW